MVRIEPRFCFFSALLLLMLPLPWVGAVVLAAGIHEMFHLAAVYFLGGTLEQVRLDIGGAVIEAQLSGKGASVLASLAGPIGSLLLLSVSHKLPRTAVCGFLQGIYNFLPIRSLDGGQALEKLLQLLRCSQTEKVMVILEVFSTLIMIIAIIDAVHLVTSDFWTNLLIPFEVVWLLRRKIPCKQG